MTAIVQSQLSLSNFPGCLSGQNELQNCLPKDFFSAWIWNPLNISSLRVKGYLMERFSSSQPFHSQKFWNLQKDFLSLLSTKGKSFVGLQKWSWNLQHFSSVHGAYWRISHPLHPLYLQSSLPASPLTFWKSQQKSVQMAITILPSCEHWKRGNTWHFTNGQKCFWAIKDPFQSHHNFGH